MRLLPILLLAIPALIIPPPASTQILFGAGTAVSIIPHSGQTNCEGKRSAPMALGGEVRFGVRLSRIDVFVRGSKVFDLEDKYAEDCFYRPGDEFNTYSYDRDKPDFSFDLNVWYDIESELKVGGEAGFFPGRSKYIGAGGAIRFGPIGLELVGRVHDVEFTQARYRARENSLPQLLSSNSDGPVLPGGTARIVLFF